jgi:hypothetical protein
MKLDQAILEVRSRYESIRTQYSVLVENDCYSSMSEAMDMTFASSLEVEERDICSLEALQPYLGTPAC